MNTKIKFSWLHIIAFLTLMFIGYITFLSSTFLNGGNYLAAFLLTLLDIAAVTALFMGLQYIKITDHKFSKFIRIEKVLLIASPFLFFFLMLPFNRFWNVEKQAGQIASTYADALSYHGQLFKDYEAYANQRIANYQAMLRRVVKNRNLRAKEYQDCGFNYTNDQQQLENKVDVLRIQLLSDNYYNLKHSADEWSNKVHRASVWNIFMINNIDELEHSINSWYNDLASFAKKKLSNEEFMSYNKVKAFTSDSKALARAQSQLHKVKNTFKTESVTSAFGLLLSLVAYLLLLLPYCIQDRHTKNNYTLLGKVRTTRYGTTLEEMGRARATESERARTETEFDIVDMHSEPHAQKSSGYGQIIMDDEPRTHDRKQSPQGGFTLDDKETATTQTDNGSFTL